MKSKLILPISILLLSFLIPIFADGPCADCIEGYYTDCNSGAGSDQGTCEPAGLAGCSTNTCKGRKRPKPVDAHCEKNDDPSTSCSRYDDLTGGVMTQECSVGCTRLGYVGATCSCVTTGLGGGGLTVTRKRCSN